MIEKRAIVRELGEEELLLPGLINSELVTNDRIKYYFTIRQIAREKAEHPQVEFPSLKTEREDEGEEDEKLDRIVTEALKPEQDTYFFAGEILSRIWTYMDEMLKPLLVVGKPEGMKYESRLAELKSSVIGPNSDAFVEDTGLLSSDLIRTRTSGGSVAKNSKKYVNL